MAPLPPLTPPPPETPGSRVPVRTRATVTDEVLDSSGSADIVLAKLRGMIARGGQEAGTVLGTISIAAHALTGADGAAIAMPRGGAVVCVGRSGEIAPELGALLNVESGISGECLRTGRIMRCDDASRDFHVDPDVCRQLNIQSIAVVPLRGRRDRVGVLEIFSSRSYAFTEEHMDLLGRLAGLAEAAWARAPEAQEPEAREPEAEVLPASLQGDETAVNGSLEGEDLQAQPFRGDSLLLSPTTAIRTGVLEKPRLAAASAALTRVGEAMATEFQGGLRRARRWQYGSIAALATVLLVLLVVLGWKVWYKASLPTRPAVNSHGAESSSSDGETGVGLAFEPATVAPTASRHISRTLSQVTKPPAAANPPDQEIRQRRFVQARPHEDQTSTASADAPQVPVTNDGAADLGGLLPASPTLPKLAVPISQGVSGGVLVHRVVPTYPFEARQMHVQGTVVLEATINEGGQIENVKVVSGSPLLAHAAMDAVRKWRYTPYLLNGKPISKETQINITFIPQ
jgi:TonB family protein